MVVGKLPSRAGHGMVDEQNDSFRITNCIQITLIKLPQRQGTSAILYKGTDKSLPQIGEELGIDVEPEPEPAEDTVPPTDE